MSNVRSYTNEELIKRVESLKSFDGWKGIFFVGVRSKEDEPNKFDDKFYLFDCRSGKPKFVMVANGTTNPGSKALRLFSRYNSKGAAVWATDIIVYDSHINARHKSDPNSYRQDKKLPYHRDGNKNNKSEEIGKLYWGIIWMNIHKAGWFSKLIGWWSAGCQVFNIRWQWKKFIGYMNSIGSPPLNTVILKEF